MRPITEPSTIHCSGSAVEGGGSAQAKEKSSLLGLFGRRSKPTTGFSPFLMKPTSPSSVFETISPFSLGSVAQLRPVLMFVHPLMVIVSVAALAEVYSPSTIAAPQETRSLATVSKTAVPASPLNLGWGPGPGSHS